MRQRFPERRQAVRRGDPPRLRTACAALLVATCPLVGAAEPDSLAEAPSLHLSGFGTFGVTHVDAPQGWGFLRDAGERNNDGGTRADIDTRLGVQANYRLLPNVELVGQLVGANRVSTLAPSAIVTMAFASLRPFEDVVLRVGRLPADYFLLGEYRNVGFAYPFVRPPVETYGGIPYAVDGADIAKVWRGEDAVWKLRGIAGRSDSVNDRAGTVISLRPVFSIVVSREDDDGLLLRASVTRLETHGGRSTVQPLIDALQPVAALPAPTVAADAREYLRIFSYEGKSATYSAVGGSYDRGPWLANLEASYFNEPSAKAYVAAWGLVGHRWGALTGYVGLSGIHTHARNQAPQWTAALTPLIGAAGAAQAQQLGNIAYAATLPSNASQRTATLGVRWDLSDRVALKLQWDRVHVDAHGGRFWSSGRLDAIDANVGSATLDFVF